MLPPGAAHPDHVAHLTSLHVVAVETRLRELNSRIRNERVRTGQVGDTRTTTGSDGLAIGAGDVIQTRKNDNDVRVANRQTWTVQAVGVDGTVWAKGNSIGRKRPRTVAITAECVSEYTHLAYASTAYVVQGVTVRESHTVLGDALDAPGVYVGMTRGRGANHLHVVAGSLDDARAQFVLALERDRADRGLTRSTVVARKSVAGLATDGPVRLVNVTKTRLRQQIKAAKHFAPASTGAQTALYGTRAAAARRSLAEIERLTIDQAARLIKAAEQRRQRAARLPDVARFGRDAKGRSGPDHGLSL